VPKHPTAPLPKVLVRVRAPRDRHVAFAPRDDLLAGPRLDSPRRAL